MDFYDYKRMKELEMEENKHEYLIRIGAKNNPEKKEDDCISQRD